jgi:L-ascorbate metabolism protein UlaG (beta-lactamase superfamily)
MVSKTGMRITIVPEAIGTLSLKQRQMSKAHQFIVLVITVAILSSSLYAQQVADTTKKKYQAKAPPAQPFGKEAFRPSTTTTIRWLGMAGFFVNSRGTTLMIDPLLEGYDMKLLMDFPIRPKDVPHLDALFATHSDNDHYSVPTSKDLASVTKEFHSTIYVDSLMKNDGLHSSGHFIGDTFRVKNVSVRLTLADHAWQNSFHREGQRYFEPGDACGFWFNTPDGTIWATGDSKFMQEQLHYPTPDVILFDYSEDSAFHSGLEGAVKIANAYPNTPLILGHWGFVDAPDFIPFNGDPQHLKDRVANPERIIVLAPGEAFTLRKIKKQ